MSEEHTGSIIGLIPELPDDLTVPGGESPDDLHVTLVYLTDDHTTLTPEHRAAIHQVLRDHAAVIEAPIVGVRTLGDDEPAATVLLLDSPELQALRPRVMQAMADAGVPVPEDTYPTYIPHITVGYGTPLDDAGHLVGKRVTLATLAAFYGPDHDEIYSTTPAQKEEPHMADTWSGTIARLGVPTGDGRIIAPGGVSHRALPLPLSWQRMSDDGHLRSVVVGRIDSIDFDYMNGLVNARGVLLDEATTPEVAEVRSMLNNSVVGPSVDPGAVDYQILDDYSGMVLFTQYEIAGATLVSVPAFSEVGISLDDGPLDDLVVAAAKPEDAEQSAEVAAVTACAQQLPPLAWFDNPALEGPTPLTITPDGRVYGTLASWDVCHVGLPGCVTPPSSAANYAYFTTGSTRTAEGVDVPVGHLTVGTGHASPDAGFRAAAEHYDHTGTTVAVVAAGEDAHGIWVAGAIVPEATTEQVEALRRSPLSGDWRRIGGNLELVAALAVNVPGFPVPRARVSVTAGGEQLSLVASARFDQPQPAVQVLATDAVLTTVISDAEAARRQARARARLKLITRTVELKLADQGE